MLFLKKKPGPIGLVNSVVALASSLRDRDGIVGAQRRTPNALFPPGVTDHLFLRSCTFWKILPCLHFSFL